MGFNRVKDGEPPSFWLGEDKVKARNSAKGSLAQPSNVLTV